MEIAHLKWTSTQLAIISDIFPFYVVIDRERSIDYVRFEFLASISLMVW